MSERGMKWYKGVAHIGGNWVDSDCGAFVRYASLPILLANNIHIFTDDDIVPLLALRDTQQPPTEPTPEDLEKEDAEWDATFARHADKLDRLIEEARNGPKWPMPCAALSVDAEQAVIAAAKAWASSDGSEFGLDECEKLLSAVNALRAVEGDV
jgi:hypothetical protein